MASNPTLRPNRIRRKAATFGSPVLVDSTIPGSDSANTFLVDSQPEAGTKAFRQGALKATLTRAAAQADTTWDGNPDTAFSAIARTNATGNVASEGAIRGANIQGRNSGTNINWVLGLNLNGRNDSGKTGVQIHGMDVRCENYGTIGTEIVGIDVNLSDESNAGSAHTTYGIRVRNTDQSAQPAAEAVLHVSHTSTNGFNALFKAAAATGDGVVASASTPTGNAAFAVIIDVAGTKYYIPAYVAVGFGG